MILWFFSDSRYWELLDPFLGIALVLALLLTFTLLKFLMGRLPADGGRAFAVNGEKSKGKPRGAGIIFVLVFAVVSILFLPLETEELIYVFLIVAAMLTGYFDDASEKPWNEYKKGILDFLIATGVSLNYLFPILWGDEPCGHDLPTFFGHEIPAVVTAILVLILVWVSINVVNCTDGVDGLCGSLSIVSLLFFLPYIDTRHCTGTISLIYVFIICLIAYLWFNCSPSKLLMGDAGSRAIGLFIAIVALKSNSPFLFLPLCIVFIFDGGLGLVKVSLKRFLKISMMKNIRTPLHDHFRKNLGWSDTQTVTRFVIIQIIVGIMFYITYNMLMFGTF